MSDVSIPTSETTPTLPPPPSPRDAEEERFNAMLRERGKNFLEQEQRDRILPADDQIRIIEADNEVRIPDPHELLPLTEPNGSIRIIKPDGKMRFVEPDGQIRVIEQAEYHRMIEQSPKFKTTKDILAEAEITTSEKLQELIDAGVAFDASRAAAFKLFKKGIKTGALEALQYFLLGEKAPHKPRSVSDGMLMGTKALGMAIVIAWVSGTTSNSMKRNSLGPKYNPQEIPEHEQFWKDKNNWIKGIKSSSKAGLDAVLCLVGADSRILRGVLQVGISAGTAYLSNRRKAAPDVEFLDGDNHQNLKNLIKRRSQSKLGALGEYVKNDLITTPLHTPVAFLTTLLSPKTVIKIVLGLVTTAIRTFTPSVCLRDILSDLVSLPKKIAKKWIKAHIEKRFQSSHENAVLRADKLNDDMKTAISRGARNIGRVANDASLPMRQAALSIHHLLRKTSLRRRIRSGEREPLLTETRSTLPTPRQLEIGNISSHPSVSTHEVAHATTSPDLSPRSTSPRNVTLSR